MPKTITPKSSNYPRWYTDVITVTELADYGPVKGTMVIRPYGYSVWEHVKEAFDRRFKETGHVNAYFPLFIPKSFLAKEAEHVEGFAKECAVVTHSKLMTNTDKTDLIVDPNSKLEEEIIVRPTSETVIWAMYKKWINSYRDLPILINQWANVVRWEMRTRLFLRTSEFLWQEGHTAHENEEEAQIETKKILDIYQTVCEDILAIPVLTGEKTESERFAGAVNTYCIEAMMGDKKALQAGTSHFLGQNFAKAFDVKFQNKDNKEEYVFATSWGVSTRLIGAIIMVHGDDKGLRLPPAIAPIQVVIIPVGKDNEDALKYIHTIQNELTSLQVRVHIDNRPKMSPGFKFNEWEMKGVPIRLDIGMQEYENKQVSIFRRDENSKKLIDTKTLLNSIDEILHEIQTNMYQQALSFMNKNIHQVKSYDEFKKIIEKGGFVRCGWDGLLKTEQQIKKETGATIRCIPFDEKPTNLLCIYSNNKAKHEVFFAKAY